MASEKTAIIIGAGPAGLTAAYELLQRSDIRPVVLESSEYMGGIARTARYKGNRIDIGGHRFFSKSDRVMSWWAEILPLQAMPDRQLQISYQRKTRDITADAQGPDPEGEDRVMLVQNRKSRIYYLRTFFDYPISLSLDTLSKLGLVRTLRIGISYVRSALFPIRREENLEHFLINRFGKELYLTFFKSYTEKVWGTACSSISAEWGAQRIKGLSIGKAIWHVIRQVFASNRDIAQKKTETSLIEQFLYPKFGPGQMWEEVARRIEEMGGEVRTRLEVRGILVEDNRVRAVEAVDGGSGETLRFDGDYFFSSMPIRDLVTGLSEPAPAAVAEVSEGLIYRDFLTVGLLLRKLKIRDPGDAGRIRDNWIYIQEPDVLVGRMQIFNNWSRYMVADPETVWIGLEYFCYDTDPIWSMEDPELIDLAVDEMDRIGIIDRDDVLDGVVIRMPKTYPAYFGTYGRFDELRRYLDRFENLFLVGRNGMHKYNNQDHSMLTAMVAVDNVIEGRTDNSNIWEVNTEEEYHEEKAAGD